MSMPRRETGTIKDFYQDKGYGFIGRHDISQDIFFHIKDFKVKDRNGPQVGMEVQFYIAMGMQGRERAKEIYEIKPAPPLSSSQDDNKQGNVQGDAKNVPNKQMQHSLSGRSRGVVKSVRCNYGFITEAASQRKVFFKKSFRKFKEPLRVGERVDFFMEELPIIGIVAKDIRPYMLLAEKFQREEDRTTEFKSLANSRSPERAIGSTCNKYICAFLNSSGGQIYFGIEDDGVVSGLLLNKYQRDIARNDLDYYMQRFTPPVDPNRYSMAFLKVYQKCSFEEVFGMTDRYVVRVSVQGPDKDTHTCNYYLNSMGEPWIRFDGGITKMSPELLQERKGASLNHTREELLAKLKALDMKQKEGNGGIQNNHSSVAGGGERGGHSVPHLNGKRHQKATGSQLQKHKQQQQKQRTRRQAEAEQKVLECAMQFGYGKGMVLDAIEKVKSRRSGEVNLNAVLDVLE
mmetsp:Transcript_13280/g.21293  ORF Transcript_13280/g.21293 Transcript_13280/m.21293 type:complete len:459 (+) Transcript_13280:115-1491(+)|eukprot:jgi/Bigna1/87151/estExt_fgenesh1_pg.C_170080